MTGYNEFKEPSDKLYPAYDYRSVKKPLDSIEIKQAVKAAMADYETHAGNKRQAIISR